MNFVCFEAKINDLINFKKPQAKMSKLDQKNSKLKQKAQGFGKFIRSSCRKQVQKRILT